MYVCGAPHACTHTHAHNPYMHVPHARMYAWYDADVWRMRCACGARVCMPTPTRTHTIHVCIFIHACMYVGACGACVDTHMHACRHARTHAPHVGGAPAGVMPHVLWIGGSCMHVRAHARGGTRRARACAHGGCLLPRSRGRVPAPTLMCTGGAPVGRVPHGLWIMHALHHTYTHTRIHTTYACAWHAHTCTFLLHVHHMHTHTHIHTWMYGHACMSCCMLITYTHTQIHLYMHT